jgi:iron(III) transport system substrate-binding protein
MRILSVVLALALLYGPAVQAAGSGPDDATIAAAKKEGTVVLYGSMTLPQMTALADRFRGQYGIAVKTLRMESQELPARMITEERSGKFEADVVDEPGFQTDQLKRQGMLVQYRPPENATLIKGTVDPEGYWTSIFLNTEAIAYNPKKLQEYGLKVPAAWSDFTKPEWRGHFGVFVGSYEWYAAMKKRYGEEGGNKLMKALAANQPRMLNTHVVGITQVESGDLAGVPNIYAYQAEQERRKGGAIAIVNPDPTVVELHCVAIVKNAPHPNAARLLERWMLSKDTQDWIASLNGLGRIAARKDADNDPMIWNSRVKYLISDPSTSASYAQDATAFNSIFGIPG